MFHEIATDVVADGVGIPDRPGQQMLHAVRAGFPGMLGERPAVLPRQLGQQPGDERPDPPPRLHPSEPAGDPAQQLVEPHLPVGRVYALARRHCGIVWSRHNPG